MRHICFFNFLWETQVKIFNNLTSTFFCLIFFVLFSFIANANNLFLDISSIDKLSKDEESIDSLSSFNDYFNQNIYDDLLQYHLPYRNFLCLSLLISQVEIQLYLTLIILLQKNISIVSSNLRYDLVQKKFLRNINIRSDYLIDASKSTECNTTSGSDEYLYAYIYLALSNFDLLENVKNNRFSKDIPLSIFVKIFYDIFSILHSINSVDVNKVIDKNSIKDFLSRLDEVFLRKMSKFKDFSEYTTCSFFKYISIELKDICQLSKLNGILLSHFIKSYCDTSSRYFSRVFDQKKIQFFFDTLREKGFSKDHHVRNLREVLTSTPYLFFN
jgi:hypothetical protein